ncbi:MAG: ABC transporter permease, partial [Candidatus Bipolaricaulota bacterium]
MTKYILRRMLLFIPALIGVTILTSSLIYLSPGDPARLMLGPQARTEEINRLREEMGLNKPFHLRYLDWMGKVVQGNLGRSLQRNENVGNMIVDRVPATLQLAFCALLVALLIAIPTGILSGLRPNSIFDNVARLFAVFWISMPSFWLGLVLLLIFSLNFEILPISGKGGPIWTTPGLIHIILPAFALGARRVAILTRLIRSRMLEILEEDYIRTARSKGLAERLVVYRHAFRNVLIPVVTVLGLQIPWLFSGSVIIEKVF